MAPSLLFHGSRTGQRAEGVGWSSRRIRRRPERCLIALLAACGPLGASGLGEGQYRLVGTAFDVEPVSQSVPVGYPATVTTVFRAAPEGLAASGARVLAELSGPGLAGPVTLSAVPGGPFQVPGLSLKGTYLLGNIRLSEGGRPVASAQHPTATIVVSDVLVTSVTSRALTTQELASRGVVIDEASTRGFSFSLGIAIAGRTIRLDLPLCLLTGSSFVPIGPPIIRLDGTTEFFTPPTVLPIRLDGIPSAVPDDQEQIFSQEPAPPPVFGVLVFPGNIRFLNQFFSVLLLVQNGSPAGSGLSLADVRTTLQFPAISLRLAQTTPSVSAGQAVPVWNAGPDGVSGTPDDVTVLAAQQTGQAEFVTEGLRVGTHEVVCGIEATLLGMASGPVRLKGQARGAVVVRDPTFALTFNHPDVVRAGEDYEIRVTVVNSSTVRANQVAIAIDASSITGAEAIDVPPGSDPSAELGDIEPSGSAAARFRFRATRTGRVVASSFTSDGAIAGNLKLRTGVTVDGVPLSPDTIVYPRYVSALPSSVVEPATALIGLAHGLATMDPTAAGCWKEPPFGDGVVRERARDLIMAARRAGLGQSQASAVTDLAFTWLGDDVPAFDALRRSNPHGRELESATGAVLEGLQRDGGRVAVESLLLDSMAATSEAAPGSGRSPAFAYLDAGDPADPVARLAIVDYQTGSEMSGRPGESGFVRDVPFGNLLSVMGAGGGELGLVGRTPLQGFSVLVRGRRAGTFHLAVTFPSGTGGFLIVRFGPVSTGPRETAVAHIVPGSGHVYLSAPTHGIVTAESVSASPPPFGPATAVQDLEANQLGRVVTILFNRPLAASSEDASLFHLPVDGPNGRARERRVVGVQRGDDPRLLSVVSSEIVSPRRPGLVGGAGILSSSQDSWTGQVPIVPRLTVPGGSVEGRVLGPDGTHLAAVEVQLTEAATDDLTGQQFSASTSTIVTDELGGFFVDFVRKQDGRPFRLDSFDPASGAKGYAVGVVHADGETVHLDVALQGRGTVRGIVVDGSGRALPQVIVRCASLSDASVRTARYTSASGAFEFQAIPVGSVQLQAEDPATRRLASGSVLLSVPGGFATARLVLAAVPRTSIRGRALHGATARPYAGADVAAYHLAAAGDEYVGVRRAGPNGEFAFSSLPAGTVRFEVFDEAKSRYPLLLQTLDLLPDHPTEIQLVVPESVAAFGSVTGIVRRIEAGASVPVPGAVVFIDQTGVRTTSSSAGGFGFEAVPVGDARVVALLPSTGRSVAAAAVIQEGLVTSVDLVFRDSALGSVTGTVVDQAGAPRADASVEIWDTGPPLRLVSSARTGGDGTFALADVTIGTSRIQATSAETHGGRALRNAGAATVTIPAAGGSAQVTIALRGFVDVTGRVIARVRDRGGVLRDNPAYTPVVLSSSGFSGALPSDPPPDPAGSDAGRVYGDGPAACCSLSTDPETGSFRFVGAHGGRLVVTARSPFYGDRSFDFGTVLGDRTVGPADVVFDGNLGVVDGFLLDQAGSPLVGQTVLLEAIGSASAAGPGGLLQARSGLDGSFAFPLVPFSQRLHATFEGTVGGLSRFAEAYGSVTASSPTSRLTLRTLPLGTVTVAVAESSLAGDAALPGAQVVVEEVASPRRRFVGVTDATGRATFEHVSAGAIAVTARKDLRSGRTALLGVGEGFRVDGLVRLGAFGRVVGTVRNPADGTGLAGVNVVLSTWGGALRGDALGAATTAADGSFSIEEVPAGANLAHSLSADDPRTSRSGASSAFSLAPGETKSVDVPLRAIGTVAGSLRTFDGGSPIPGRSLRISSSLDGAFSSPALTVTAGPDGEFRAEGVPAGTVTVDAFDPGAGLSAVGTGLLAAEGQVIRVDLRAVPTGRIQGVVADADGASLPPGGVSPEVRLQYGLAGRFEQVALASAYDFGDVAANGPFSLRGMERVPPFHLAEVVGQLAAGESRRVDLRYAPIGSVRVHVRKPDPLHAGSFLPVAGTARIVTGGPYRFRFPAGREIPLDAAGDALFEAVGGGFGMGVNGRDGTTSASGLSVVPDFTADGQTRDVTVVVEPRGVVRGRLLLPGGLAGPARGFRVVVVRDLYPGGWTAIAASSTGPDGRFEIGDLLLGNLQVRAAAGTPAGGNAFAEFSLSPSLLVAELGDLTVDDVPPRVTAVNPPDGTTGVDLNPAVTVTFSEPIGFQSGPLADQIRIQGPAGPVALSAVSFDATRTVLTTAPGTALAGGTPYEIRVSGSISDRSLLPLGADFVARFTTADVAAPSVLTSAPLPEQVQVRVDTNPFVVLTKPIAPGSLVSGVRLDRLADPPGPVPISPALREDGRTIVLNPAVPFAPGSEYVIVLDGVTDTAGHALASPVSVHFFTRDDIAPTIAFDPPDTPNPVEGTTHTYVVHWPDRDLRSLSVFLLTPRGEVRSSETTVLPPRSERSRTVALALPSIAAAGGTAIAVRAVGQDFGGNTSAVVDLPLTIAPDRTPPNILRTWPADGTPVFFGTAVKVGASVSDDVLLAAVRIAIDGGAPVTVTAPPYEVTYSGRPVATTTAIPVVVEAEDATGNRSSVGFALLAMPPTDPGGPGVAMVCPGAGVFVPPGYALPVSVAATALGGRAIARVEFFVGASPTPFSTVTSPVGGLYPATCPIPATTPDGAAVALRVRAIDTAGLESNIAFPVDVFHGSVFPIAAAIGADVTTYERQTLFVTGGTLTVDGPHVFNGMAVLQGATVTHSSSSASNPRALDLDLGARGLFVACGASIDVSGRGYPAGATFPGIASGTAGSHMGRASGVTASGVTYGSVERPSEPGAGGSLSAGGGVVHVVADRISLPAATSAIRSNAICSGPGAGGSVHLVAGTIQGDGAIEAKGATCQGLSGGGAISVEYGSVSGSILSHLTAEGVQWDVFAKGGAGTVWVKGPGSEFGDLTVDHKGGWGLAYTELPPLGRGLLEAGTGDGVLVTDRVLPIPAYFVGHWVEVLDPGGALRGIFRLTGLGPDGRTAYTTPASDIAATPVAGDRWQGVYRFDNVDVASGLLASLDPIRVSAITSAGIVSAESISGTSLQLKSGAKLGLPPAWMGPSGSTLSLSFSGAVTVETNAAVDVTGRGLPAGSTFAGAAPGSPGSHLGLASGVAAGAGASYGSVYRPGEPGAGGIGNAGGGVVRISAGTLDLQGTSVISANGDRTNPGPGAGGSVHVTTGSLKGDGTIEAKGMNEHGQSGGGAISIEYADVTGSVLSKASAGGGYWDVFSSAGAGTIYSKGPASVFGDLTVDNKLAATPAITELPSLGSGTLQAGTGSGTLVLDRAGAVPGTFAGHWVELQDPGGGIKGTFRVGAVLPDGRTLSVIPDAGVSSLPSAGDRWFGLYRFDRTVLAARVLVKTADFIRTGTLSLGPGAQLQSPRLTTGATATPAGGDSAEGTGPDGLARPGAGSREDRLAVRFLTPYRSPEAVPPGADFIPAVQASEDDRVRLVEYFLDDSRTPCLVRRPEELPPASGCRVPDGTDGTMHRLRAVVTDEAGRLVQADAWLVVRDGIRIARRTRLRADESRFPGSAVYVENEVTLEGALEAESLFVRSGASILAADGPDGSAGLEIRAEGDLVVDSGGVVSASGVGAPSPSGGGTIRIEATRITSSGRIEADGRNASALQPAALELGKGGSVVLLAREGIFGPAISGSCGEFGLISVRAGQPDRAEELVPRDEQAAGGQVLLAAPVVEIPLFRLFGTRSGDGSSGLEGTAWVRDAAHPDGMRVGVPPPAGEAGRVR